MSDKFHINDKHKKQEFNKQRELEKEIKNGKNLRGTVRTIMDEKEDGPGVKGKRNSSKLP